MGANDVKIIDVLGNVAGRAAAAVSHKLHPMIEQYAQLFDQHMSGAAKAGGVTRQAAETV